MDFYRERVNNKPCIITCVSSSIAVVLLLIFLTIQLNTMMSNVNDALHQSQNLMLELNTTNHHFDRLVTTMQNTILQVDNFLSNTSVILPHVDSLVMQINSSLPTYTNAVASLNLTEIQYDISHISDLIGNLTILANRVAHFFHI